MNTKHPNSRRLDHRLSPQGKAESRAQSERALEKFYCILFPCGSTDRSEEAACSTYFSEKSHMARFTVPPIQAWI